MSAGLSPASTIAFSAASACSWICDMSGMTPSRVVSAAPTMAIDLGFMAGQPVTGKGCHCERSEAISRRRRLHCVEIASSPPAPRNDDYGVLRSFLRRAEKREGDLVVELLKCDLDRHIELQRLGGLRAPGDVGHHARPFVELDDRDRIGRREARHRAV